MIEIIELQYEETRIVVKRIMPWSLIDNLPLIDLALLR